MATINRVAEKSEDEYLSRVLANAFLPIWNHNWIQNISRPIPTLPYDAPLSTIQERRRKFYHALIQLTRLAGGSINVATVDGAIVAILLWLDPHCRPTVWDIFMSGFARISLWDYGLRALYRVQTIFERNLDNIAIEHNLEKASYAYVQMLAVHPSHAGHGYAASLLRSTIEAHYIAFPNSPGVMLDSTTLSARAVYKSLGFIEVGTAIIDSGCDALGFRLDKSDPNFDTKRAEALRLHEQALMLLKH